MPTVPLYGAQRVDPSALPSPQQNSISSGALLSQGAAQDMATGQALQSVGGEASQMMTDQQNIANQVRVNDAVNQLKTQQQTLTYDPNSGFMHQTGLAALQRDSGMPLADEYAQKLNDTTQTLSSSLSNPVQQRMFNMQAQDITTQFHGQATQWEGQQFKAYQGSVNDGTVKVAQNDAVLYYNDPDRLATNVQAIKAAVYANGKLNGLAAVDIENGQRQASSAAIAGAVTASLQKGNVTYADNLMQKFAPDMSADDIMRINGQMNGVADHMIANQAVGKVLNKVGPAVGNSPFDRMVNITAQSESGGKDFNPDGSVVTSPTGAMYKMQVVGSTNKDPGYGVRPAQDDTPAERNRVGRDYLQALLGQYGGDPAKAWAAYHDGPGALDDAMAKAKAAGTPNAWAANLTPEGQKYVAQNMQALNSNSNSNLQRASKLDVINAVRSDPALQARPERMQIAVTLAGQQYDEQTAAIKQTNDANKAQVLRTLEQNRGNVNSVSPVDMAKLNPDDVPEVLKYAKNIAEGSNTTNTALYQTLITSPKMLGQMSNNEWQAQAPNFSIDDFKHLTQIRADQVNNTGTNSPGSVNLRAMNETLTQRLQTIGLNPYPKFSGYGADPEAVAHVGAIRQFVTESLLGAQKEAGKKFTEADIESHIDGLFAKSVTFNNVKDYGLFTTKQPDTTLNMMSMTDNQIPNDVHDKLTADFKSHGIPNPTQGQLLGAYWHMKTASQGTH